MQLTLDPKLLAVAIFVVDVEDGSRFRFIGMNPAAEAEFGFPEALVVGKLFGECLSGRMAELLTGRYAECVRLGRATQFEDYADLMHGRRWFRTTLSPTIDPASGQVVRITAISQNISASKRLQAEMTSFAFEDPLTGLANRRRFDLAVRDACDQAVYTNTGFSLVVVDLDGLKDINDRHGHRTGDDVIRFVGSILEEMGRPGEIVARVGGDEFYLLVRAATVSDLEAWTTTLRTRVDKGLMAPGFDEPVSLSVGGAVWSPGQDPFDVLSAADAEMYRVKAVHALVRETGVRCPPGVRRRSSTRSRRPAQGHDA